jgi:antitoxin VapB
MDLRDKNSTAEKLVRPVAAETGESVTEAVLHSLEERRRSAPDLVETLLAISRRCSALPDLDSRDPDEILGYDIRPAIGPGFSGREAGFIRRNS